MNIDKTAPIAVEVIFSQLMQQKQRTMIPRFKLSAFSQKQVFDMLSAAVRAEVETRHRTFIRSELFDSFISSAADWLTDADDPHFGLFISGNKGNGKSTLLKAIETLWRFLQRNNLLTEEYMPSDVIKGFVYTSAKNIVSVAKNQERADLKRFYNIEILAIDDLGTEPRESISYGDYITATTDIILHRYDRQLTTLCTSNLVAKEIANYYDERVADRFREMMKIINFGKTPSFR